MPGGVGFNFSDDFLGLSSLFVNDTKVAEAQGAAATSIAQVQAQVQSEAIKTQAEIEAKKAETIKLIGIGALILTFFFGLFKFFW